MNIRIGYDITYHCPQPTPMVLTLNVHYTRVSDLVSPDHMIITPSIPMTSYRDGFGNWCTRIVAPAGHTRLSTSAVIRDSGQVEWIDRMAPQHPIEDLPEETLVYLLGSRYCDTDRLSQVAWDLFDKTPLGAARVQAVCDFVHRHITFGYEHARSTRTALEAFQERRGVCRDFTHLAVALCRCLNIPARYCTGYLGDMGTPPPWGPMDFAAWFEVFLGGRWHTYDARNNMARIGRVLIARGRDAADVPISTTFGPNTLANFSVVCEETTGSVGPDGRTAMGGPAATTHLQ